jgi:hypothetical protein
VLCDGVVEVNIPAGIGEAAGIFAKVVDCGAFFALVEIVILLGFPLSVSRAKHALECKGSLPGQTCGQSSSCQGCRSRGGLRLQEKRW